MQIPTAIYVRLSKDKTGAGLGVARQEKECRDLIERMPGYVPARVFVDNDISAYSGKPRPGYLALLVAIKEGSVGAVVAWHTDRLHRSPLELEAYIDAGAPTFTVTAGHLDLATPAGRMTARTLGAVARYEMEQKSERQKAKNRQTASMGLMSPGGPVPFGYEPDRLRVHPVRGQMIRDAYRDLLRGASLGSVIRTWNSSSESAPRGGYWTYSTVRGVLTRAANAGLVVNEGAVLDVRGKWEPLVTEEDYYALVALLGSPSRRTTDGRARKHLLAGVAACGNCGRPLKSGAVGTQSRQSPLYRCRNPECTKKVHVAREPLNDLVVSNFLAERGGVQSFETTVTSNGEELAELQNRIRGVTSRLGADDVDVAELLEQLGRLKARRRELDQESTEYRVTVGTVRHAWESARTVHDRQRLLREHLAELSVASRGKTSHRFDPERVTLRWKPLPSPEVLKLKKSDVIVMSSPEDLYDSDEAQPHPLGLRRSAQRTQLHDR